LTVDTTGNPVPSDILWERDRSRASRTERRVDDGSVRDRDRTPNLERRRDMNLISTLVAVKATRTRVYRPSVTDRLRRAGYADGERQPRITRHWANR